MASTIHVTISTANVETDLGYDAKEVAVLNSHATAVVYVKIGAAATVKGANTYRVPPGARRTIKVTTDGSTLVNTISTAASTDIEIEGD